MTDNLLIDIDDRGVATVTMNRPDVRNAFNSDLIAALHDAADSLGYGACVRNYLEMLCHLQYMEVIRPMAVRQAPSDPESGRSHGAFHWAGCS